MAFGDVLTLLSSIAPSADGGEANSPVFRNGLFDFRNLRIRSVSSRVGSLPNRVNSNGCFDILRGRPDSKAGQVFPKIGRRLGAAPRIAIADPTSSESGLVVRFS